MKSKLLFLVALLVINAATKAQTTYKTDNNSIPTLGYGFDSKKASVKQVSPFVSLKYKKDIDSTGRGTKFTVHSITTRMDFLQEQDFDAKLTARYVAFSAKANINYSNYLKWSEQSVVWSISLEYRYGSRILVDDDKVMKKSADSLLKKNPIAFKEKYGDSYVCNQNMGNSISILYIYNASSKEEKQRFSMDLSAALNSLQGGVSVDASFQNKINTSSAESKLDIIITADGSDLKNGPEGIAFTDLSSLKEKLEKYLSKFNASNAACLDFQTAPYPDANSSFSTEQIIIDSYFNKVLDVKSEIQKLGKAKEYFIDSSRIINSLNKQIQFREDLLIKLNTKARNYFDNSDKNPAVLNPIVSVLLAEARKPSPKLIIPKIIGLPFKECLWTEIETIALKNTPMDIMSCVDTSMAGKKIKIDFKGLIGNNNKDIKWVGAIIIYVNGAEVVNTGMMRDVLGPKQIDFKTEILIPSSGELKVTIYNNWFNCGTCSNQYPFLEKGTKMSISVIK